MNLELKLDAQRQQYIKFRAELELKRILNDHHMVKHRNQQDKENIKYKAVNRYTFIGSLTPLNVPTQRLTRQKILELSNMLRETLNTPLSLKLKPKRSITLDTQEQYQRNKRQLAQKKQKEAYRQRQEAAQRAALESQHHKSFQC